MLAEQLDEYKNKSCAVVALTPGAILVGAQIAMRIHATLAMLLTEEVTLPGENEPLAAVTPDNTFTYNSKLSAGQIDEMRGEFMNFIEGQRLEKLHHLHYLLGHGGEVHRELLNNHIVILVSDGMSTGFSLDVAMDYLKPVKIKKLIAVTPIASANAVDKMHLTADKLICLNVAANFIETNHYYEDNTIPAMEDLLRVVLTMPVHWSQEEQVVTSSHKIL